MNKEKIKKNISNCAFRENEDIPVINYLNSLDKNRHYSLLEVGSGECRFVKKVLQNYSNIDITCIEINTELAKIAIDLNCEVINDNILNIPADKKYDIVHCSHVIEHFSYPAIANVMEFLVFSTAPGGRLIVRSPLMWKHFYDDIDHVRPYPPESFISYFGVKQQQKKGNADISIEYVWYRTEARQIEKITKEKLIYGIPFVRGPLNFIIGHINSQYQIWWNKYRWPASKPTGYVAIIKHNGINQQDS